MYSLNLTNFGLSSNHEITYFFSDTDFKVGDMVTLSDDEHFVKSEFQVSYFRWDDQMRLMLGKIFTILSIYNPKTVALPSPDGSYDGRWHFPTSLVTKITASGMKLYFNSESDSEF